MWDSDKGVFISSPASSNQLLQQHRREKEKSFPFGCGWLGLDKSVQYRAVYKNKKKMKIQDESLMNKISIILVCSSSFSLHNPRTDNSNILFRMQISFCSFADFHVIWKHQAKVVTVGTLKVRKDFRAFVDPYDNSSLTITGVDPMYTGNYSCEIEWSNPPLKLNHYLEVQVPPSIHVVGGAEYKKYGAATMDWIPGRSQQGNLIEAIEGQNVTLKCQVEGIPTPTVEWVSVGLQTNKYVIVTDRKAKLAEKVSFPSKARIAEEKGNLGHFYDWKRNAAFFF